MTPEPDDDDRENQRDPAGVNQEQLAQLEELQRTAPAPPEPYDVVKVLSALDADAARRAAEERHLLGVTLRPVLSQRAEMIARERMKEEAGARARERLRKPA